MLQFDGRSSGFADEVSRAAVAPVLRDSEQFRRISADDKRVINGQTDVNQLVPFKYKWAWEKYLAACANHWMPQEIPMSRDIELWKNPTGLSEDERRVVKRVEVARDDAKDGAKLGEIPGGTAEEPQRRNAVLRRTRPVVQRQHPNQRGLAGPVRSEHSRVLAVSNTQRQALEDARTSADKRRVLQLEHGIHAIYLSGRSGKV